jgi:Ca2+-binding EF-hand superfamily protein
MKTAILAGAMLLVAGQALAQADGVPRTRAAMEQQIATRFRSADTNQDGAIDQAEAARMMGVSPAAAKVPPFEYSIGPDGRPQLSVSRAGAASGMIAMLFTQVDANSDAKLQLGEAQNAARQRFDRADRNRDGTLSGAEVQAARAELAPMLQALGM